MNKPKPFSVMEDDEITIHYESAYQPGDGRRNAMCAQMWPLARTLTGAPSIGTLCKGCQRAHEAETAKEKGDV